MPRPSARPAALEEHLIETRVAEIREQLKTEREAKPKHEEFRAADLDGEVYHESDKVVLYKVKDGEPSVVMINLLSNKLKERDQDGNKVWSLEPGEKRRYIVDARTGWPRALPVSSFRCLLHPEDPQFMTFFAMGITGECKKDNLPSRFAVVQHMRRKHKEEYAALVEFRDTQKQDEQFQSQKTLSEALSRVLDGGGRL